jgi:hypothetical protein
MRSRLPLRGRSTCQRRVANHAIYARAVICCSGPQDRGGQGKGRQGGRQRAGAGLRDSATIRFGCTAELVNSIFCTCADCSRPGACESTESRSRGAAFILTAQRPRAYHRSLPTLPARQAMLPLSPRHGGRPGSPRALPALIGGAGPGFR